MKIMPLGCTGQLGTSPMESTPLIAGHAAHDLKIASLVSRLYGEDTYTQLKLLDKARPG
jgi:hypothetical protein